MTSIPQLTLREQRVLFTHLLAKLIEHAFSLGYQVSLEEVKRTPAQAAANAKSGAGIKNSLHLQGLAADLNLYRDGVYLARSQDHAALGAYWKSLHPLNCWGGDFKDAKGDPAPDGNHYSSSRDGVK